MCPEGAPGIHISFALETGVMAYYRKTELQEKIFINSNREEDEIILDHKGSLVSGENINLAQEISQVYKMAIEDISLSKVKGAIFYLHSNIPAQCFSEEKSWLTAFFLSIL